MTQEKYTQNNPHTHKHTPTLASAAATNANEDTPTAPKTAPSTSFRDVGSSADAPPLPPGPAAAIVTLSCRAAGDVRAPTPTAGDEQENADAPLTRAATTIAPLRGLIGGIP